MIASRRLSLFVLLFSCCVVACAQKIKPPTADGNPTHIDLSQYPSAKDKVTKSDAEWRTQLGAESYDVLRQAGTERAFTGSLLNEHHNGVFVCAGCGNPLFSSATKFESGTGWPSFWAPIEANRVIEKTDNA